MGASKGQQMAKGHAKTGSPGKIGMVPNPHTSTGGKSV